MLVLSDQFREILDDKEAVDFAIFYHDIVYSSTAKDNGEKSAELAVKKLQELSVGLDKTEKVRKYILATKHHSSE